MELTKDELVQIIKILLAVRRKSRKNVTVNLTSQDNTSSTYVPSAGMYWDGYKYVSPGDKKQH